MPMSSSRIIDVITELSEVQNLRVTVSECAKGAVVTGACAFVGGIVGGPVGLGVGGVVGACVAAYKSKDKFRSVVSVINDMTPEQRERLAESVQRAIQNVHTEDIVLVLSMVMTSNSLQALVINQLKSFLAKEMNLRLI